MIKSYIKHKISNKNITEVMPGVFMPVLIFMIVFVISFFKAENAGAIPADHFTPSSVLAEGKWVRVSVESTGMTFISNSSLKSMGFSNPEKVNVYGYGGREVPGVMHQGSYIDDLPKLPCVRTAEGLIFYAVDNITWNCNDDGHNLTPGKDRFFNHSINRYSDNSYYFLSDSDTDTVEQPVIALSPVAQATDTLSFVDRIVYEKELFPAGNTGAIILGDDFRSTLTKTYSFDLTDNLSDEASVTTSFGLGATGTISTLKYTANGVALPSTNTDNVSALSNNDMFVRMAVNHKHVTNAGRKLDYKITVDTKATIKTAALDYIEVEWLRKLRLDNGVLNFYLDLNMVSQPKRVVIENCTAETQIWDVTDYAAPSKIEFERQGDKAIFYMIPSEYREFVAFNPSAIKKTVAEPVEIANQNIHAMEIPEMLIVAPSEFTASAERLAALHRDFDSMKVAVIEPGIIYNEFSSGNPDAGAIRKLLKMWHERASVTGEKATTYCLIMARPTYDNKGKNTGSPAYKYPKVPIWQSLTGISQNTSYSTDDYMGMIDDCDYFTISKEKIRVAIARWPVKTAQEAETMVNKLEKYMLNPNYGAWRNNVMIIADDQDNAIHFEQAQEVYESMRKSTSGHKFLYERLYLDSYPLSYSGKGACYPEAKERMLQKFNDCSYINYIGHANPRSWTHEGILNWTDINSFSNTNLPFLYAATCEFNRWDDDAVSGAEIMWLNPTAGVIGMICPSRSVYISQNGTLNVAAHSLLYNRAEDGKGQRVGDFYINGKNKYPSSDDNKLRYTLMSDPALRIISPEYTVKLTTLGDTDMTQSSYDYPELKAKGRIKASGCITNSKGELVSDFNGILELTLFDAEKLIETYGNGAEGKVRIYNDRKTRLYNSRVTVKDGLWETTILMPVEIENSYNPALISMYAYDPTNGCEANGATENLYVFGYDSTVPDDNEGPMILNFSLNSESFKNGDVVNANPVVRATLSDPSGINISDAGIGHKLSLTLDGTTTFDDINTFFMPDPTDQTKGSFTYPVSGLSAGEHSLKLTAWDNANNSTTAELTFNVGVGRQPVITSLLSDASPAVTSTVFTVNTDQPLTRLNCRMEVLSLDGRMVWSRELSENTDINSALSVQWDLRDNSGSRVPRGIYLYRATIETTEGATTSKTCKMAVAAG